jgi:Ca2+-binding RTX toxin-like protein
MRARLILPALVALALFAVPSLASAAVTLDRNNGTDYDFTGDGAVNSMTLTYNTAGQVQFNADTNITVIDDTADHCSGENTGAVICSDHPTSVDMDLAGGNDTGSANVSSVATFTLRGFGGAGNDNVNFSNSFGSGNATTVSITDTSGDDQLTNNTSVFTGGGQVPFGTVDGGIGNDVVAGSNSVAGGTGNDRLSASSGFGTIVSLFGGANDDTCVFNTGSAESCSGGTGTDLADFSPESNVIVSLNGLTDDGPFGGQNGNANQDNQVEIVQTGGGPDIVNGGAGNDTIRTGGDADVINGGGGDDVIDGQQGPDVMNGGANGAGGDTVTYDTRAAAVRATPDGLAANDGEANENDNVGADIENLIGGFGDDAFGGNPSNNNYNGGLGDDNFDGVGGNDTLVGGPGDDSMDGGANDDTFTGGTGEDTISGGADTDVLNGVGGADLLDGGTGVDTLNGGEGADTLLTRDGQADTSNCGNGTDHAVHDVAGDTINADCEISDTGAAGFREIDGPREPALATVATPTLAVAPDAVAPAVVTCVVSRAGRGAARVKCRISGAAGAVTAKLVRGRRTFAKARRNGSGRLTLRASRRARAGRYTVVLTQGGRAIARLAVRLR